MNKTADLTGRPLAEALYAVPYKSGGDGGVIPLATTGPAPIRGLREVRKGNARAVRNMMDDFVRGLSCASLCGALMDHTLRRCRHRTDASVSASAVHATVLRLPDVTPRRIFGVFAESVQAVWRLFFKGLWLELRES